ncbi:hypothetical protein [Rhizobium phage RHph_X2_26]|nr:hypothetical protein [Rhizobium phage RHph_X2_26]
MAREIDIEGRPASIDAAITKYTPALKKLAYGLCKGDYYRSTLLFADTVIHCLENWQTYRAEDGGVWGWLSWRMRGVHSHNARKFKLRESVESAVSIQEEAIGSDNGSAGQLEGRCIDLQTQPNQEHHVEVMLMLDRLKGVKYSHEFLAHAMGYSYEEISGGAVSSQAVHQRTAIAKGIAQKGL